jgi:hypothetical protein
MPWLVFKAITWANNVGSRARAARLLPTPDSTAAQRDQEDEEEL